MYAIAEVLYTSHAAATADGKWSKWAALCRDVTLDTLCALYRDPVPTPDAFAWKYRTESITPRKHQIRYLMVE